MVLKCKAMNSEQNLKSKMYTEKSMKERYWVFVDMAFLPTDAQERSIWQLGFSIQNIDSGKDSNYLIQNIFKLLGIKDVLDV